MIIFLIFVWFVDLIWVEWKFLSCLRVYEIEWVWHSWLSILSSWLRLFGWRISCLTIKYSLTVIEVGCGVIELSVFGQSLVDRMWSLLVSQMCLLLDELGQVRRVGWLLVQLTILTQVYDWFGTGKQASWYRLVQLSRIDMGCLMCSWLDSHWMSCMSSWFDSGGLSLVSSWLDSYWLS